jgi:HEAT repeat protein
MSKDTFGIGHTDKLSEMLTRLRAEDPGLRRDAAIGLGRLHDAAAVPALIAALRDRSPRVAEEAAEALGLIGDRAAVPPLVDALRHPDSSARVGAVKGLGSLRDSFSTGPLVAVLGGDPNWLCRREAAVALGDIGDPDAASALIGALDDNDTYNRTFAVEALGKLRVAEAAPRIVAMLDDSQAEKAAVEALVRIGAPSVSAILSGLRTLEQYSGRPAAFLALGKLGPPAIDPLIRSIDDAESDVRAMAAAALGEIGDPRAVERLSSLLGDEPRVRNAAAIALSKIGTDGARVLLEATRDTHEDVREAAVAAVSRLGNASSAVLIDALDNGTPRIRAVAIAGLARIRHPEFSSLVAKVLHDPFLALAFAAPGALQGYESPETRAMLIALLSDSNPTVREFAARASGQRGNSGAVQGLARLLEDPDRRVALAAVAALGAIDGIHAIDALRAPLRVDDDEFQRALARARESLGIRPMSDPDHEAFSLPLDFEPFGLPGDVPKRPPDLTRAPLSARPAFPDIPTTRPEPIELVSYYPTDVRPSQWYSLLAYVCTMGAREAVEQDSRERSDPGIWRRRSVGDRQPEIARGTEITIKPALAGFEVNPSEVRLQWLEDWHRADFRIKAIPGPAGPAAHLSMNGHIDLLVSGLIVGRTPVSIFVADDAATPSDGVANRSLASARPFQAIFASYSHQDSAVVDALGRAYKALGNQFLRDVESLRSGEVWRREVLAFIDRADIFQLFWSSAAKRSPHVEMEWRHALRRELGGFIRPVFWERPMPSPPEELSDLHFAYFEP